MAGFSLERLNPRLALVLAQNGWPTTAFVNLWQRVMTALERAIDGLADAVVRLSAAEGDINALESPQYLTLANTTALTNERRLVVSGGLSGADAGAGSTYTVGLASIADQRILANVSGGSAAPTATAPASILGVGSALKWTTARTLSFTGGATGSGSIDGSGNVSIALTLVGAGATAFIGLSDVPASYSGQAGKAVRVNAGGSGLEFYTPGGGVSTFTGLSDVPASYTGQSLKSVRVNAGETALEFFTPASGGSVTSVALSAPAMFSVSGSPVTTSGTLTFTLATQSANLIFAGPGTGAAAAPTFRAMVAADLPNTAVTPGSYTNVNATVDAQGRITAMSNGSAGSGINAYFPAFTTPVDSDYAWINQGGASVTVNGNGGIFLRAPVAAALSLRVRKKAAPATPYTVTAALLVSGLQFNYQGAGLCWRQSSDGKLISAGILGETNAAFIGSTDYSAPTTFTADNVKQGGGYSIFGSVIWFQITDNGTNRIAKYSRDGYNFIQFYSESRTTFLTGNEVGFYAYDITNTYEAGVTLLSWAET